MSPRLKPNAIDGLLYKRHCPSNSNYRQTRRGPVRFYGRFECCRKITINNDDFRSNYTFELLTNSLIKMFIHLKHVHRLKKSNKFIVKQVEGCELHDRSQNYFLSPQLPVSWTASFNWSTVD